MCVPCDPLHGRPHLGVVVEGIELNRKEISVEMRVESGHNVHESLPAPLTLTVRFQSQLEELF